MENCDDIEKFKFKPTKVKQKLDISTLDTSHKNFMNKLNNLKNEKNKNEKKLLELQEQLKYHDENNNTSNNYLLERSEILDEIEKIEEFLENIDDTENNYFYKTKDILTTYYTINKNYRTMNEEELEEDIENDDNNKNILDILQTIKNENKKYKKETKKRPKNLLNKQISMNIFDFIDDKPEVEEDKPEIINKSKLYEQYKRVLEPVSEKININICMYCNSEKLNYVNEGVMTCTKCSEVERLIIDVENVNYRDNMIKKPIFPYDREHHFNDWLNNYQTKDTTVITVDIIEKIKTKFKSLGYTPIQIKNLNGKVYKEVLKSLKLQKYYKNISYVIAKINDIPAPSFTKDIENELKIRFKKTQEPFEIFKPKTRINYLSYTYVLYKLCEQLYYEGLYPNYQEHKKFFILFKNNKILKKQDIVWCNICNYNSKKFNDGKWKFYSSKTQDLI